MLAHRRHQLPHREKRGISLIELLIAMSASIIIAGVISAVFINSWKAQISQEAYTDLQQKGRISVDEISATIKAASGVETAHTSGSDTYTTSASVIVLMTPSIDASNNILPATDYFIFQINTSDNTKLDRIIDADSSSSRLNLASPTVLNNVMGSVSFRYYNAAGTELTLGVDDITTTASVIVKVTSQKVAQGRTITREFDNTVYLRNTP